MANIERRTTKDGALSFRVKIRLRGFPVQTASFSRLTDAKRWAQATEAAIREGRYFKTAEARRHTFADMIDRYLAEVLPHRRSDKKNTRRLLSYWKRELGSYTLADVTPALITDRRSKLLAGTTCRGRQRGPATVVRYLAALSHVFTIAMKEWEWVEDTPMRRVTKPKEPPGRCRVLSDDERTALLDECKASTSSALYTVVILALSTGMRRGEILSLRWPQVDLERGRITLETTKNGDRRGVPLTGLAHQLLAARSKVRRIDTDLLFPGTDPKKPVDITTPWERARVRAKLADFRFHDLRHSAASYMAMEGASVVEIAEVLGHRTLQMVRRYSHLTEGHARAVVTRMNAKYLGEGSAA
ncbi:MAG: site-specific integrase [Burkholderiales bacterium]|nr:site-specific integrase [Burkholderiales bacterium]